MTLGRGITSREFVDQMFVNKNNLHSGDLSLRDPIRVNGRQNADYFIECQPVTFQP